MNRKTVSLVALFVALLSSLDASSAAAQTTFRACRVPAVGVIYMIGVSGAPSACLDASHVEFQWTEGGAPADNTITSAKITDGTIAAVDVADGAVTSAKIADGTVATIDVTDAAITTAKIADGTIATADVANGAITQAKIDAGVSFPLAAGAVGTTELADNAVTSAKIAAGTVAAADLATGSVTSSAIADATIATADIADASITQAKIDPGVSFPLAAGAVGTAEIADGAVTDTKLAADAVTAGAIADGSVYASDLSPVDQTWSIWGTDGVVSFHPYFGDAFGTTLTRTDLSNTLYPQARFVGPSGNNWDYGLNGSDNFTIEVNDAPVCTLTTQWSCPATIPVDGVGSAEIAASAVGTAEIETAAVTTAKLATPTRVAYAAGGGSVALTNSRQNAASVSITVGGAGSIVVYATGVATIVGTNCAYLYYGISDASAGTPDNIENWSMRSDYGAVGVHTFFYAPLNTVYVAPVGAAGTYTYYLVAYRSDAITGTCSVLPKGMSAVFIPS